MKTRRHFLSLLLCALALAFTANHAQAMGQAAPVQGQLLSRSHGAVPGVTAYLVHPVLGRSAPSYTDLYGRFGWGAIPIRPEAYFLEIYWGQNLFYRQPIVVHGPLRLAPIYL
jgi:hypothetical protein